MTGYAGRWDGRRSGLVKELDKADKTGESGFKALGSSAARQERLLGAQITMQQAARGVPHIITMNSYAALAMADAGFAIGPLAAAATTNAPPPPPPPPATTTAPQRLLPLPMRAPPLLVPPGSTLHILHSNKMALEVGELIVKALTASQPQLKCELTSTETFRQWAGKVSLMDPKADDEQPVYGLFIIETVENEQPSEAAGTCTRFIHRRSNEPNCLKRLNYCVLGLGDSNLLLDRQTTTAKDCNQAAKALNAQLKELGATPFYTYGNADDRTGNQEVQPWIAGAVKAICLRVMSAEETRV